MHPIAFISSLTTEHKKLRKRIFDEFGDKVWIAEYSVPELKVDDSFDLEIVDTCTEYIQRADHFICIFAGRQGSPIKIGKYFANATHFETELFHAAQLGKKIHVFIAKDFEPHEKLRTILEVLSNSIDKSHWKTKLTEKEIHKQIRIIVTPNTLNTQKRVFNRIIRDLFNLREQKNTQNASQLTEFFLGDFLVDDKTTPNLGIVQEIIGKLDSEKDYYKRLSRIYIAYRELMGKPSIASEFLVPRNELLGHWAGSASWYGLHGHIPSGVLAAVESMAIIRERLRSNKNIDVPLEKVNFPGGELASARYSISKHLDKKQQRRTLETALENLKQSLKEVQILRKDSAREANLLAIRGSIFRAMGQIKDAVSDYEKVVLFREKNNASSTSIGEGLSELGFGYLHQLRLQKGKDYSEKGVQLLKKGPPSGFLVRALRKLAVAYVATGHPIKAYKAREEARRIAYKRGMLDQIR